MILFGVNNVDIEKILNPFPPKVCIFSYPPIPVPAK